MAQLRQNDPGTVRLEFRNLEPSRSAFAVEMDRDLAHPVLTRALESGRCAAHQQDVGGAEIHAFPRMAAANESIRREHEDSSRVRPQRSQQGDGVHAPHPKWKEGEPIGLRLQSRQRERTIFVQDLDRNRTQQ